MVRFTLIFIGLLLSNQLFAIENAGVRLKDLARVEGDHQFSLVGYGLVVGLSGSGDSMRNKVTLQSLANTLSNFGLTISENEISSRNVAAVIVTAEMPAYSEPGDRVDISVASMGDARSLSGGTLLLTALYGPDKSLYALGQGSIVVGGYKVTSFDSSQQKNHPTVGQISRGAIIEQPSPYNKSLSDEINIILNEPDYTTAERLVESIHKQLSGAKTEAIHPGKIKVQVPENMSSMKFMAKLEHVYVQPDVDARVVVNERTGTIVAGGNVSIGEVSISHGSLHIEVTTKYDVSQPGLVYRNASSVESVVTPDTEINIIDTIADSVAISEGTSVADLVHSLQKLNLATRDIIVILQSIKAAGALHAQLVIQ